MSESGGSQPQDDSDEDIYKDFSDFNFGDELAKLEHSKDTIKKEAFDLSEQVKVLTKVNEELKKSNEILKKNMSCLLKTAQAEVQRKDSMIEELRNELDSFAFRRKNKKTKDVYTQTQDLDITVKARYECVNKYSVLKRSKSKECRTSSDSEKRCYQEEGKKKECDKEENCDNNRNFGSYRDCAGKKSRHSDSNNDSFSKRNDERHSRRSTNRNQPNYKGSFSENYRGHAKYHSLDKRKRSRSSDRRFTYRRKNTREKRSERLEESPERWREEKKEEFSDGFRRKRSGGRCKSRSRERSRGSSLEIPKLGSSPGKHSISGNKDISCRLKETNSVNDECKKEKGHSEKDKNKSSAKSKRIVNEESLGKNEKAMAYKFSTKSPLDTLYSEMMTSRSSSRFSKQGTASTRPESDLEENKFPKTNQKESSPVEEKSDWSLSFKNERKDTIRPMTLYSKRMMQKLTEAKEIERLTKETKVQDTKHSEFRSDETEKEPGELTDDENVIESSKEFQELTKVASIENAEEKKQEVEVFKEPMTKETIISNKPESRTDETELSKEVHPEMRDVVEFSPFKNNYKLIEISPIKPPNKEKIMEMYNKRKSTGQMQKEVESSIFNLLSSLSGVQVLPSTVAKETKEQLKDEPEKQSEKREHVQVEKSDEKVALKAKNRKNPKLKKSENEKPKKEEKEESKSEKNDEFTPGETTQFLDFFLLTTSPAKQIVGGHPETPGKTQTDANVCDVKCDKLNSSSDPIEEKNTKASPKREDAKNDEEKRKTGNPIHKKQDTFKEVKKTKEEPKKENENKPDSKIKKRKRESESEPESKKAKLDKSPRKRTRSQQNSGSKTEKPECEPHPEPESKIKEDITTFEFFKPIAKKENLDTSTECKMTTMSVANIVCLETPSKSLTNVKNLMINEQMILNVLDGKNAALCSPLMTPRRMLKNDLMLTDSEDDSGNKGHVEEEEAEEEEEEEDEMSESENSECESDSGASDFVDLL